MLIIFQTTLIGFFTGPFHHLRSSSIKNKKKTIENFNDGIIVILIILIDIFFYIVSLNSSLINKHQQNDFLHEVNRTLEIIRFSKTTVDALLDECLEMNPTASSSANLRDKLSMLKFVDQDESTRFEKEISTFRQNRFELFHRVRFFVLTYSIFLYIHQLILWFLHYFSSENSTTLIFSIVLLVQSFVWISFVQIVDFSSLFLPLNLYIFLISIRCFASIYDRTFRNDE